MSSDQLPVRDLGAALSRMVVGMHMAGVPYRQALRLFETTWIEHALEDNGGHQGRAAKKLGMHRNSFWTLLKKLKIHALKFKTSGCGPRHPQTEQARQKRVAGGRRGAAVTNSKSSGRPLPVFGEEGGRGESPEQAWGGKELAAVSTAHLAQSSKPPRGLSFADFQFQDPDLECGGLLA